MWRIKKSVDEMAGRGRIGEEPFSQMKSFWSSILQKMVIDKNYHKCQIFDCPLFLAIIHADTLCHKGKRNHQKVTGEAMFHLL